MKQFIPFILAAFLIAGCDSSTAPQVTPQNSEDSEAVTSATALPDTAGSDAVANSSTCNSIDSWSEVYPCDGTLRTISVGKDGSLWGTNDDDEIYKLVSNDWDQQTGHLRRLGVGKDAPSKIWGTEDDYDIHRWTGSGWTKMNGHLDQVDVAADGTIWGKNDDGEIYKRVSGNWNQVSTASGSPAEYISVGGSGKVWYIDTDGDIFQWNGSGWTNRNGVVRSAGYDFRSVAVTSNGRVFATTYNDDFEYYPGVCTAYDNPGTIEWKGSSWEPLRSGGPFIVWWQGSGCPGGGGQGNTKVMREVTAELENVDFGEVLLYGVVEVGTASGGQTEVFRWTGSF